MLQKHGVSKGDRVLIYMPMIPEAVIAMLASARLGAIHSLVFGGFASRELSTRIEHAKVCFPNCDTQCSSRDCMNMMCTDKKQQEEILCLKHFPMQHLY